MHHIDRTVREQAFAQEFNQEFNQEFGHEARSNYEFAQEFEDEMAQEFEGEYEDEYEGEYEYEDEFEDEYNQEGGAPFSELREMQLASELLNVSNEQEMEQFWGGLLSTAIKGIGNFARSSAGRALGGVLKNVAKVALPVAGKALGTMVGGPVGGMLGGKLANMAGKAFGLELEGLSAEDREFEVARAYVRFAGNAARKAARLQAQGLPPAVVANKAVIEAAHQHAPGLVRPLTRALNRTMRQANRAANRQQLLDMVNTGSAGNAYANGQAKAHRGQAAPTQSSGNRSGRWTRRGRTLIIYGI